MIHKIIDWVESNLPLLLNKESDKLRVTYPEAKITAYWAGTIIRIDIKPTPTKEQSK